MKALCIFIWLVVGLWWSYKAPTYDWFVHRSVIISVLGVAFCWLVLG